MRHCQSFFKLIGRNIRILRSSWVRQGPKSFLAISTSHILQTVIIIFANKTKRWRGGSLLLLANQLNFFTPAFSVRTCKMLFLREKTLSTKCANIITLLHRSVVFTSSNEPYLIKATNSLGSVDEKKEFLEQKTGTEPPPRNCLKLRYHGPNKFEAASAECNS